MKNLMKFLAYIVSALFAYFFPDIAGEGFEAHFVTFTAFAPLVILLAGEFNTWREWEGNKAWAATAVISLALAYVGYLFKFGIMAEAAIWHPVLYGLGAFGVAVAGFSIEQVKLILRFIFDYSFKR